MTFFFSGIALIVLVAAFARLVRLFKETQPDLARYLDGPHPVD